MLQTYGAHYEPYAALLLDDTAKTVSEYHMTLPLMEIVSHKKLSECKGRAHNTVGF